MRFYEITGYGFDGTTDKTDDRVIWVAALGEDVVTDCLVNTKATYFGEIAPPVTDEAIDYYLPIHKEELKQRLLSYER